MKPSLEFISGDMGLFSTPCRYEIGCGGVVLCRWQRADPGSVGATHKDIVSIQDEKDVFHTFLQKWNRLTWTIMSCLQVAASGSRRLPVTCCRRHPSFRWGLVETTYLFPCGLYHWFPLRNAESKTGPPTHCFIPWCWWTSPSFGSHRFLGY